MKLSEFDMLCIMCNKRKDKPMNNAEWLFSDHERFCRFFNCVARADYEALKSEFNFVVESDLHDEFYKWIQKEHI